MVAHACHPSTQAGGWQVWGQSGLPKETLSEKKKKKLRHWLLVSQPGRAHLVESYKEAGSGLQWLQSWLLLHLLAESQGISLGSASDFLEGHHTVLCRPQLCRVSGCSTSWRRLRYRAPCIPDTGPSRVLSLFYQFPQRPWNVILMVFNNY
jgi:hypothetical protein